MFCPHILVLIHTVCPGPHILVLIHTVCSVPHILVLVHIVRPVPHILDIIHTVCPGTHILVLMHTECPGPHTNISIFWFYEFCQLTVTEQLLYSILMKLKPLEPINICITTSTVALRCSCKRGNKSLLIYLIIFTVQAGGKISGSKEKLFDFEGMFSMSCYFHILF
jgi:hypothetical protein